MKNEEERQEGSGRLIPLTSSKDFKVAKDNPDVRGWRVVGSDGERLGVVKDLIVDTTEMKVRYLAITADTRFYNDNYDHYLLVPIGSAALDKKGSNVFISNIDSRSIVNYPTYHGGPITDEYEYAVREAISNPNDQNESLRNVNATNPVKTDYTINEQPVTVAPQRVSGDFYNNDQYNESRFFATDTNRNDSFDNRNEIFDNRTETSKDRTDNYNDRSDFSRENINTDNYSGQGKSNDLTEGKQSVEDSISTIERLEQLRERGSITEEEFKVLKRRALNL